MRIPKPNSTKKNQRMHNVLKQCTRCYVTYNVKTRKDECPHELDTEKANKNNFDTYTEMPKSITFTGV
jgi:hypothetical protein